MFQRDAVLLARFARSPCGAPPRLLLLLLLEGTKGELRGTVAKKSICGNFRSPLFFCEFLMLFRQIITAYRHDMLFVVIVDSLLLFCPLF